MIARRSLRLFIVTALITAATVAHAQQKLTAAEAKDHVGERATVCGAVVSTRYAAKSRGEPTFLNLDKAYPDQIFTIVIWGRDRSKFGAPETRYANKNVCVTGTIVSYRGVPEIDAAEPSEIKTEN